MKKVTDKELVEYVKFEGKQNKWNTKLEEYVKSYIYNEDYLKDIQKRYREGQLDRNTFFNAVQSVMDVRVMLYRSVELLVRRLLRHNMEIKSEYALQLYDCIIGNNDTSI